MGTQGTAGFIIYHVIYGLGTVWENPTCGLPVLNPICAPLGSKWCGHFNHKAWLTFMNPLCSSASKWLVISTTRSGSPFVALLCPIST